jgi:tetratricopeptide (TPR) repeat protein
MAHITRKEMKEDAIQEAGVNVYDYLSSHFHQILTMILVVLAILLAIVAVRKYSLSRTYTDNAELYAAQQQYENGLSETDAVKRKENLNAAIDACDLLYKKRPNSRAGHEALFVKGNIHCLNRNYAEALQAYETYERESSTDEQKAKGKIAIGDMLSNQAFDSGGNDKPLLEKAQQVYAEAEKLGILPDNKKSYLHYQALMGTGRVLTQAGDLAGAKKVYERVVQERPFFDEKLTTLTLADMGEWEKTSRGDKAKLLRKNLMEAKAIGSFQKTAERHLEEIDARMKVATKP